VLKFLKWLLGDLIGAVLALAFMALIVYLSTLRIIGSPRWIVGLLVFLGVCGFWIARNYIFRKPESK
jgi:hypothetical protein